MHRLIIRRLVLPAALLCLASQGCGDDSDPAPVECVDDCFLPPAPACRNNQAVTFGLPGTCQQGVCTYVENATTCTFGCANGRCLPDPCEDVFCNRPPAAWCEGDIAVTSSRTGVCENGFCEYGVSRFSCASIGQFCDDGACVEIDPCEGVFCQTPPRSVCGADGDSVISFSAGQCREGECSFRQTTTECSAPGESCVEGACTQDPRCDGVVCNTPPTPFCSDNRAYTYASAGTCDRGQCVYPRTETRCSIDGATCFDGECVQPACEFGDCREVPEDSCDGDFALQYAEEGVCTIDGCVFPRNRIGCTASPQACPAGQCVNLCAGIACDNPPANACEGNVAVRYSSGGVCTSGACSYAESRLDCSATGRTCDDGDCVSACTGVDCFVAPEPVCLDRFTVRALSLPGACVAGLCEFNSFDIACGPNERCAAGACVASIECADEDDCVAPAPFCDGAVAVTRTGSSDCVDGSCSFDEAEDRTNCAELGLSCRDGRCVADDPCEEVTCETPPAPRCAGAVLVSYEAPGACELGECRFTENRFDCGANGQLCVDGACEDVTPCLFTDCTTAVTPPPWCDGNFAVVPLGPGDCDDATGLCTREAPETRTECIGQVCINGSCQPVIADDSLVISEFYVSANRFDRTRTWLEVANVGATPVALANLRLRNSLGTQSVITSSESVAPGARAILAATQGDLPSPPNGVWGDAVPLFNAFGDSITLLYGGTVLDVVPYGTTEETWPFALSNAIVLTGDVATVDNAQAAAWCLAANIYNLANGSRGTPGAAGADCLP